MEIAPRLATEFPGMRIGIHPHNDGGNVVMVDGHAKWFSKMDGSMNEPASNATNRMWAPTLP